MATSDVSVPDFQNPAQLAQALLALYLCQTEDERSSGRTLEDNDLGFNANDAPFLTSVSDWLISGKPFTERQQEAVRKVLQKYVHQLERLNWQRVPVPPQVANLTSSSNGKSAEQTSLQQRIKNSGQGLLLAEGDQLLFWPNVYPSIEAKEAGFRWDKQRRCWAAPLRYSCFAALQRYFPKLTVDETTQQKLHALAGKLASLDVLRELPSSEKLFPFQREAVAWLAQRKRAMLSLAPGLGKTAVSLFATQVAGRKRVLIVSPLSLLFNWRNEIRKWLGPEHSVSVWHGKIGEEAQFTVTNYDTLRKFFGQEGELLPELRKRWDCLILDETILIKNRKAQRTHMVKKLASEIEYVWELTGAPISRCYDDMWAQLNILDPQQFRSYWRFAERYCVLEYSQWGTKILRNQPDAAERLQSDLRELYYARTQEQVLDLPEFLFEAVEVPMSREQWRLYREMEQQFKATLGQYPADTVLAPGVLAQLTRLIQIASNPALIGEGYAGDAAKWSALEEMLEWLPKPVIVWTNFIQTANSLTKVLRDKKLTVAVLTGETPEKDRGATVESFQRGEIDVLLAHPGVGKFGLTLTRSHCAVYLERSFNADDYYQSLHRIRRIGTVERPYIIHLLSTGPAGETTVDHVIDMVLRERKDSALKLTAGQLLETFQKHIGESNE